MISFHHDQQPHTHIYRPLPARCTYPVVRSLTFPRTSQDVFPSTHVDPLYGQALRGECAVFHVGILSSFGTDSGGGKWVVTTV